MRSFVSAPRLAAAPRATATRVAAEPNWVALTTTKPKLVGSEGGRTTRNVDGTVYEVIYDEASDSITVFDRKSKTKYPASVTKEQNLQFDLNAGESMIGGEVSFEAFQEVLRADGPGPEILNGRIAMLAVPTAFALEAVTGTPTVQTLTNSSALALAGAIALATTVASLAPVAAGNASPKTVFPSDKDAYADRVLPYTWNPLAEKLNGRVAMLAMAVLLVKEAFAQ